MKFKKKKDLKIKNSKTTAINFMQHGRFKIRDLEFFDYLFLSKHENKCAWQSMY